MLRHFIFLPFARPGEGGCGRRLVYDVMDLGKITAGTSVSRFREDQVALHQTVLPGLLGGAQRKVSGLIYLGRGTHLLSLSAHGTQQVGESNKSKNKAAVMVDLRHLDQTQPGRGHAPWSCPSESVWSSALCG